MGLQWFNIAEPFEFVFHQIILRLQTLLRVQIHVACISLVNNDMTSNMNCFSFFIFFLK